MQHTEQPDTRYQPGNPYARLVKETKCDDSLPEPDEKAKGGPRVIHIKLKRKHAKIASLVTAAMTGVVMSLVVQGVFDLKEPAWFCVNAVFGVSVWYLLQKHK